MTTKEEILAELYWDHYEREIGEGTKKKIEADTIKRYVNRARKERRSLTWELRLWIFRTNRPLITSLTCRNCDGTGDVPAPTSGEKWKRWFEKSRFRMWQHKWNPDRPDLGNELPPDDENGEVIDCQECAGTGRHAC